MAGKEHIKVASRRLTREESRALTREKQLESAYQIMAREGYEGASIDRIAEQEQQERLLELAASPPRPLPHPKTWKQQPSQQMERKYQAHLPGRPFFNRLVIAPALTLLGGHRK